MAKKKQASRKQSSPSLEQPTAQDTATLTLKEHEGILANEQRHYECVLEEERAEWKEERTKLQIEKADAEQRLLVSKDLLAATAASHEKTIAAWKEKYDSGMKRERAKTAKKVQKEKDLLKEFKAELKRKKRSSYEAFQMTGPGAYRATATATATTATDNDPNDDTTDRDTAGSPSASEQQPARKRASISKNYRKQDNVHDLRWNQRLEELQKFREQHGHCLVPWRPRDNGTEPANKLLAQWVSGQRTEYRWLREGKPTRMSPERIQLLNSIGFQWQVGPEQNTFEFRMVQLATFQGQQGHCNVPQKLAEPAGLGEFVLRVRRLYRQGKLPQERVEALEALGFQWSLRNRGGTLEARMQQQQPPTLQQPQPQHPPPAVEVQNNNNGDSSPY
jgi:hypothetical protein